MNRSFLSLVSIVSLSITSSSIATDDVLLITSEELKESWQTYADWKAKSGKNVKIITTQQISKAEKGIDIQEKIRLCVRDHIDTKGTRWVVIGGDSQPQSLNNGGIVPDRDTVHTTMWGTKKDIPTDIYYLSPTNWDSDGDGIYGEFVDDKEDITYPDGTIGLGRIPVRTAEDVAAYTAKVISYESNYPEGEFSNNMTYTCTVSSAYPKVMRSWDDHVSKQLPDGKLTRFFVHKTPWDKEKPGDFPLSTTNLVDQINSKTVGKFHIHGHGLPHCWVLEDHEIFTAKHVAQLNNKDAYPIITTVSCFTGQYDTKKDPSIVESMLRVPEAGAIAVVAPCREGKPHFVNPQLEFTQMVREGKMDGTTETMTLFWENGIGKKLSTGEALMLSKSSQIQRARISPYFHMCLCELNLLGDPTIMVHPENSK